MNDTTADSTKDYSDGLNLPQTDFPMRAGLPEQEPRWLKFWEDIGLWDKLRANSKERDKYILHDGPPYANGHLHIGHALNKILKDIINRSRQMLGYDAHYVPGWDCHGLPIEWKIEEKYRAAGQDKDAVDIVEFRKECRDFAAEWVEIQKQEFKRLGVMGNWQAPYLTMNYQAEAAIAREFCKFLMPNPVTKEVSLFRGEKPVLWSIVEKTALAEAEVEYKTHKSIAVYVRFPITTCRNADYIGAAVPIWTTTVWTIPCNRGIAFHKDIAYGFYEVASAGENKSFAVGEKFLLAEALLPDFEEVAGIQVKKIHKVNNEDLQGLIAEHPLRHLGYDHEVPAHHAEFVDDAQGSGFVHVSPAHGTDDYYFGKKHGLKELPPTVSEDGHYTEHMPHFVGHTIYTNEGKDGSANGAVLKELTAAKALLGKRSLRHSYPHSWRSKAPLIYRNTSQWFISMEKGDLRKISLKAIDDTEFYPNQGKARLYDMIENRPDWCISRQRAWGVPLTLFVHKTTDAVLQDEAVNQRIYDIFCEEGADAWFRRPASDFLGDKYNADDYTQVSDVLDVWFDSGSTHSFVLEERDDLKWPADLYLEGSDQHRGWFHSSLLESCGTRGRAPYDAVLTHGFVLAEDGQKMSKSLGNITTPQSVYDELGADILRLWVVASNYYEELSIGPKTLKQHSDSYRRFRNTWRFLLGNLYDFNPETDKCDYKDLDVLDKWVLHRLAIMNRDVSDHCDRYEFHRYFRDLHDFCTNDLSALYFDIRKDRLYCEASAGLRRRATQTVLHEIFLRLTTWLAPILCFTAEEAWQARRAAVKNPETMAESVHLCDFIGTPEEWRKDEINGNIIDNSDDYIVSIINEVRAATNLVIEEKRRNKELGSSLEAKAIISMDGDVRTFMALFKVSEEVLADYCIVSAVELKDDRAGNPMVVIEKAPGDKCERCWRVLPQVLVRKRDGGEPICDRCLDVLQEDGV